MNTMVDEVTVEMTEEKKFLTNLLKKNILEILFTKADGSERKMICTLKYEHLPKEEIKESTRRENVDVIPVWDLELMAWRSFRPDSLIMYTYADYQRGIV